MDIVYTLSNNYDREELKYSLRSLANLPHGRVFFVGGCPTWVQGVTHIPTVQNGTKYKNTTHNLITACNDPRISANFILFNDDFFVLEPIKAPTKELNLYNGTVQSVLDKLNERYDTPTPYMSGMSQTKEFLAILGVTDPKSYELHIPFVLNKKKFLKIFDLPGVSEIPCFHKRTVYGNLYLNGGTNTPDVKVFIRDGFMPNPGKFLSCDNAGFSIVYNYLQTRFPHKSQYEI